MLTDGYIKYAKYITILAEENMIKGIIHTCTMTKDSTSQKHNSGDKLYAFAKCSTAVTVKQGCRNGF